MLGIWQIITVPSWLAGVLVGQHYRSTSIHEALDSVPGTVEEVESIVL